MARPISYAPPPAPVEDTPHEALERLLQTLHESGTLRLLDGLVGQAQDVGAVLAGRLDTPGGRNALSTLLLLVQALGRLEPDHVQAFLTGTEKGLAAAHASFKTDPPGLLQLFGVLKHEDTRRGLHALLVLLQTLGNHLHDPRLPAQR